MNPELSDFLAVHKRLTRRYFLRCGAAGAAALSTLPLLASGAERDPALQEAIDNLETWLTKPDDFGDVSRGKPKPHSLDEARRKEVGLTRETWQLEVISDPEHKARLRNPLTKAKNTAFTFADLMKLSEKHAVRFAKVMTCLNVGCPLGNGIWEGVPLREVLWLTQPSEDLRRVFYYGYHNDDPQQMFRSSLPVGRVLEDLYGLPPVILCYKLNGQWLTPERGAPVRVVVPEAYGFKNIKWLSHVVLSNRWNANDTYGEQNNDVDSPLKTFCETLSTPGTVKAGQPIAVTGYAQVGISGLKSVQVWIQNNAEEYPDDDPHFTQGALARRGDSTAAEKLGRRYPGRPHSLPNGRLRPRDGRAANLAHAADQSPLGRAACPACPPASTRCAAAPSTRTASPSRCRGRFASRGGRRLRWCGLRLNLSPDYL